MKQAPSSLGPSIVYDNTKHSKPTLIYSSMYMNKALYIGLIIIITYYNIYVGVGRGEGD